MVAKRNGSIVRKPYNTRFASYRGGVRPFKSCTADKDCGPLEICHEGKCVWFDEVPLGNPALPSYSPSRQEAFNVARSTSRSTTKAVGPSGTRTYNPFLRTYNPFSKLGPGIGNLTGSLSSQPFDPPS